MKNMLLLSVLCSPLFNTAQTVINSSIEEVIVFQQGAQVVRDAEIQLSPGSHSILFDHLTQDMDPSSIYLEGKGDFTILSISPANNYLREEVKSAEIIRLEEKQKALQRQLDEIQAEEEALQAEKQMITANQKIGGESGISVQQLQQAAAFFNKRIKEINLALIQGRTNREEVDKEKQRIDRQLNEEKRAFRQKTAQVKVELDVNRATKASFRLTYMVRNAGWYTEYDARVTDLNSPLQLIQKANITQQTGEDWTDIKLILSTAIPSSGGQIPGLPPLHVDFAVPITYRRKDMRYNVVAAPAAKEESMDIAEDAEATFPSYNVNENLTQQEYTVSRKQDIYSSPEKMTVVLRQMEIPASYEYQVHPALDQSAFLIARVYDWDTHDLLNGEIALYNGNTYVGKSFLNTERPEDTLDLSLGRDRNIVVQRERIRDKQESSLFGSFKTDVFAYRISIRNNKNSTAHIVVKDRIPLSGNEDIKVSVKDTDKGSVQAEKGIVKWKLNLAPGTQEMLDLSYEVKYPAQRNINFY